MEVSIIIVNYNTEKYIKDCIKSIYEHVTGVDFEIIIVDNKSTEKSLNQLKELYPEVRFLMLDRNLGFGTANNRGAEIAKGEKLFLLNPDTILLNNAVKILSDAIDSDKEIGVCGGNLFNEDLTPAHSYTMIFPGLLQELDLILLTRLSALKWGRNKHFNHSDNIMEVARISGANMMIRKSVYDELEGFDETFFMYEEETELQFRMKKCGYKQLSIPQSEIVHLEGKSFTYKEYATRFGIISHKKFLVKRYKSSMPILLCNFLQIIASLNFVLCSLLLGRKELCRKWWYIFINSTRIDENTSYHN